MPAIAGTPFTTLTQTLRGAGSYVGAPTTAPAATSTAKILALMSATDLNNTANFVTVTVETSPDGTTWNGKSSYTWQGGQPDGKNPGNSAVIEIDVDAPAGTQVRATLAPQQSMSIGSTTTHS